MTYDISIYVSCYNEEEHIINTIIKLLKASKITKKNIEIIICDDASTDNSSKVVEEFIKNNFYKNILIINNKKTVVSLKIFIKF